jgi:hypothetical protein
MTAHATRLSPLNFAGLIALATMPSSESLDDHPARKALAERPSKRSAIECWQCPDCDEIHDSRLQAEECCEDDDHLHTLHDQDGVSLCPICASTNTDAREASDCCLWKDFDAHTRWAMADQVEAGALWVDLLQINRKDITQ